MPDDFDIAAAGSGEVTLPSRLGESCPAWARLKRDVKFALRERFGCDKWVFQTSWLYSYDVASDDVGRGGFQTRPYRR